MHLDTHLTELIAQHGSRGVYGVLFGIVFAETGLVITPFLPVSTFRIPRKVCVYDPGVSFHTTEVAKAP